MKKICAEAAVYLTIIGVFVAIALLGNRAITVIAEKLPADRKHTIIIDAGHGGEDGGATSCTGRLESGFNLEIAQRLDDLLHLLGYRTKMIRTTDSSVYTHGSTIAEKKVSDLKQRVSIVNSTPGALLVSIHQNTFSDGRYSGAQVFYDGRGEGRALAEQMQAAFCRTVNPGSNRKCKKANGVFLMERIECLGILVECGFLSNREEEAKLQSVQYQQKLCCVIASTLTEFLTGQDDLAIME